MRVRTLILRFAVFELPCWDQGKEHPSSLLFGLVQRREERTMRNGGT